MLGKIVMIDSGLGSVLLTAFTYGICGSLAAAVMRILNRDKPGPRFDQVAAIGFLVGAAFGAFMGIFETMLVTD